MKKYSAIIGLFLCFVFMIGCSTFRNMKQNLFKKGGKAKTVEAVKSKPNAVKAKTNVIDEDKDDDAYDVDKDSMTKERLGIGNKNDLEFDLDDEE
ncbi:MAG: hypothetical protein LHV68_12555 [Elusimicrobia bacterium]|nr:hypothetical protein [Candidatus Liberimonas magnetica]